jgi:hypothetical protein
VATRARTFTRGQRNTPFHFYFQNLHRKTSITFVCNNLEINKLNLPNTLFFFNRFGARQWLQPP